MDVRLFSALQQIASIVPFLYAIASSQPLLALFIWHLTHALVYASCSHLVRLACGVPCHTPHTVRIPPTAIVSKCRTSCLGLVAQAQCSPSPHGGFWVACRAARRGRIYRIRPYHTATEAVPTVLSLTTSLKSSIYSISSDPMPTKISTCI